MNKAAARAAEYGMHSLSPHLVIDGAADAIEFYKKAFGAEELMRLPGPDGRLMHAAIRINGSSVMLVDENRNFCMLGPKALGGTSVTMHLIVDDADALAKRAESAGAKIIMPVAEQFWGDRYGVLEDPFGHKWAISTPMREMTHEQIAEAAKAAGPM
jgi:PhnB protein